MKKDFPLQQLIDLLPHAAPILMVDRVIAADRDSVTAQYTVAETNRFLCDDGKISETCYGEIMAQTGGIALSAFYLEQGHTEKKEGYVIAMKNIAISRRAAIGNTLTTEARRTHSMDNFHMFSVQVGDDGGLLAKGEVKVYVAAQ